MQLNIFIVILLVTLAFVGGFFLARQMIVKQFKKDLAENPRIDINGVRAMMSSMGQKPSEAKVQQVYRQIKNSQREAIKNEGKK